MIGFVKGKIVFLEENNCVVLTNCGVGYSLFIPFSTSVSLLEGAEVEFFVETIVREDAITLFGFKTKKEQDLFNLFLQVNKVGPKLALAIVSAGSFSEILSAISTNNSNFFKNVSGIGKKTAEKIIIDLKDKIKKFDFKQSENTPANNKNIKQVKDAEFGLIALGFNPFVVKNTLSQIKSIENKSAEIIIREALLIINKDKK